MVTAMALAALSLAGPALAAQADALVPRAYWREKRAKPSSFLCVTRPIELGFSYCRLNNEANANLARLAFKSLLPNPC